MFFVGGKIDRELRKFYGNEYSTHRGSSWNTERRLFHNGGSSGLRIISSSERLGTWYTACLSRQ
jgi:hypothetical protein